jgi:hypothetical protein
VSYAKLNIGDVDPDHGVEIKAVIEKSADTIVYIDIYDNIMWKVNRQLPEDISAVLNQVAIQEAKSEFLAGTPYLFSCRKLLAEALSRAFMRNDLVMATSLINEAKQHIAQKNRELGRQWFYSSAYISVSVLFLLYLASLLLKEYIEILNSEIFLSFIIGGVGALMSIVTRTSNIKINATEGKVAHILDGMSRIVAGCIGGFFMALLVKSGLIFGGEVYQNNEYYLVLAVALLAGASERLVPSLINKLSRETSESESGSV